MIANLEEENKNDLSERIIATFITTREEIKDLAEAAPDNMVESVHLIRKRLKFLRAFAKLIRFCSDEKSYKPVNYMLRDSGRLFSDCRDAHVRDLLLNEFIRETSTNVLIDDLIRLNEKITQTREHQLLSEPNAFRELISELSNKQTTNYFESLDPNSNCLTAGLTLGYEKSYHAFHSELKEHEADLLHEWRKRTKDLQHQMEVLSQSVSARLHPSLEQVSTLCEVLGNINDLFMFFDWLDSIEESIEPKNQLKSLKNEIQLKLTDLENQADKIGYSIFKLSPDTYQEELRTQLIQ